MCVWCWRRNKREPTISGAGHISNERKKETKHKRFFCAFLLLFHHPLASRIKSFVCCTHAFFLFFLLLRFFAHSYGCTSISSSLSMYTRAHLLDMCYRYLTKQKHTHSSLEYFSLVVLSLLVVALFFRQPGMIAGRSAIRIYCCALREKIFSYCKNLISDIGAIMNSLFFFRRYCCSIRSLPLFLLSFVRFFPLYLALVDVAPSPCLWSISNGFKTMQFFGSCSSLSSSLHVSFMVVVFILLIIMTIITCIQAAYIIRKSWHPNAIIIKKFVTYHKLFNQKAKQTAAFFLFILCLRFVFRFVCSRRKCNFRWQSFVDVHFDVIINFMLWFLNLFAFLKVNQANVRSIRASAKAISLTWSLVKQKQKQTLLINPSNRNKIICIRRTLTRK